MTATLIHDIRHVDAQTATVDHHVADRTSRSSARRVVGAGVLSGLVAAAATTLVAVIAKAADVPLRAAPRSADAGEAIPMSGYAFGTLMSVAVGIIVALVLRRFAKRPARTFTVVTVALTVLSFLGPITTGHATTATRVVLELTHVVAAVIVIPAMARTLPARKAGA
jgi:hypothetical protein